MLLGTLEKAGAGKRQESSTEGNTLKNLEPWGRDGSPNASMAGRERHSVRGWVSGVTGGREEAGKWEQSTVGWVSNQSVVGPIYHLGNIFHRPSDLTIYFLSRVQEVIEFPWAYMYNSEMLSWISLHAGTPMLKSISKHGYIMGYLTCSLGEAKGWLSIISPRQWTGPTKDSPG